MPFVLNKGRILLGDSVAFAGNSDIQFNNIETSEPEFHIGDRTFIGHGCSFHIARSVSIGSYCNIAEGVRLRDIVGHPMDAQARRTQPTPPEGIGAIRIGDDVWIGTGAMVLRELRSGTGPQSQPCTGSRTGV
jgi:acetyltransferase-like isoleucine patch superfamily enzyme